MLLAHYDTTAQFPWSAIPDRRIIPERVRSLAISTSSRQTIWGISSLLQFRPDAPERIIRRQLQLFDLTLVEVPDFVCNADFGMACVWKASATDSWAARRPWMN